MLHKLQGQDWRKDEMTNGDRSLYQNYILTFLNERRPTTKIVNSSGGGGSSFLPLLLIGYLTLAFHEFIENSVVT